MTPKLFEETMALLIKDKGNLPDTARQTGLGREWLAKLSRGRISDPGVRKVEVLHAYLSEKYPDVEADGAAAYLR